MRAAARGVDPADHRAHEGVGLHHAVARSRGREGSAARRAAAARANRARSSSRSPTRRSTSSAIRALRDLLGSVGHSSAGRHDTRDLSTGIETSGAPKPLRVRRHDEPRRHRDDPQRGQAQRQRSGQRPARRAGIEIAYSDLMVAQGEYQSSCATVLMLDCSHSMILYGEDRFTPAKRVAMALSHLIRTQYPGDTLHAVLFHDSAPRRFRCASSAACASARTTPTPAKACASRAASSRSSARTCGRSS